jgi:hypothetical protein
MPHRILPQAFIWAALLLLVVSFSGISSAVLAPTDGAPAKSPLNAVACRVMESFPDQRLGVSAVLFHQRDKPDGPVLGEFLLAHSGQVAEIETADGRSHRVTVFRVKSCFGRGLLLLPNAVKLAPKDEFVLKLATGN